MDVNIFPLLEFWFSHQLAEWLIIRLIFVSAEPDTLVQLNNRMVEVGRNLWRSPGPTPVPSRSPNFIPNLFWFMLLTLWALMFLSGDLHLIWCSPWVWCFLPFLILASSSCLSLSSFVLSWCWEIPPWAVVVVHLDIAFYWLSTWCFWVQCSHSKSYLSSSSHDWGS